VAETILLPDGTPVAIDGPVDVSLPVVILIHGLGGSALDMTAPEQAYPGLAYNKTKVFPFYRDEHVLPFPPFSPVARLYLDPLATGLTSWSKALTAAGFTTAAYTQKAPNGTLAPNVAQLIMLITKLASMSEFSGRRFVLLTHSRGGVIARSALVTGQTSPSLLGPMSRVSALIALHSPNAGSGWAGDSVAITTLLTRLITAFTAVGVTPPAFLTTLLGLVADPVLAEIAPGGAVLAGIAAGEPVPGILYFTFGGTSVDFARLWADVYTPDSAFPFFLPFILIPFFHWGSTPVIAGVPLNAPSFIPAAALTLLPVIAELTTAMNLLAAAAPEFRPGAGDLLVTDASATLPFGVHTTNALNHLEALYDPVLQAQVIATLLTLRNPLVTGRAHARISPYPAARGVTTQYSVVATDAQSGLPLPPGPVTVRNTFGGVDITAPAGATFDYDFTSRLIHEFDPLTGRGLTVQVWPGVTSLIDAPYGLTTVDTGL